MLPIAINQIEYIEIFTTPQIHNGIFNEYGLINIHTRHNKRVTIYQSVGNKTGDPGPYVNTKYQTPNVDKTGTETSINMTFSKKNNTNITLGANYKQSSLTDWAILQRNKSIYNNNNDRWLASEVSSSFIKFSKKTTRNHSQLLGIFSNAYKYFLFFNPLSREIPVKNTVKHLGFKNKYKLSKKIKYKFHTYYSNNQLNHYQNEYNYDFSWNLTNLLINSEIQHNAKNIQNIIGFNSNFYTIESIDPINKNISSVYDIYGCSNFLIHSNLSNNINVMLRLINKQYLLKGSNSINIKLNQINRISLILSYYEQTITENNSYIYWLNKGYNPFNHDYSISNDIVNSKISNIDFTWHSEPSNNLLLKFSFFNRFLNEINVQKQNFSFLQSDGSFNHTPLIINSGQDRITIGANLLVKLFQNKKLEHNLYYDFQKSFSDNNYLQSQMREIPIHQLKYKIFYSPLDNLSFFGILKYTTKSIWQDYESINDNIYLELYSESLKYNNVIDNQGNIDLGITKWFYKKNIKLDLLIRNLLNSNLQYHPIGPVYDLAWYLRFTASI